MFTTISTKRIGTALGISVLSLAAIGAIAQTPQAGRFNLLPKNISPLVAQKLTSDAAAAEKREDAAEDAAEDATMKRIEATLAPERRTLKAALDKEAWYAAMNRESERIRRSRSMTDAQRMAAFAALEAKYRPFYERTVKASGVNMAAVQAKLSRLSPDLRLNSRFMVVGQAAALKPESKILDNRLQIPGNPPPASHLVFRRPFNFESDWVTKHGLTLSAGSFAKADAQAGSCEGNIGIIDGVGYSRASAAVGQTFTVPAGVKRIQVLAAMRRSYGLTASAAAAVSGANSKGYLEISGTNVRRVKQQKTFGSVTAPLFWYSSDSDGPKSVLFSAAADIPPQGATVRIRSRITCRIYTAGFAGNAFSTTRGNGVEILVHLIR